VYIVFSFASGSEAAQGSDAGLGIFSSKSNYQGWHTVYFDGGMQGLENNHTISILKPNNSGSGLRSVIKIECEWCVCVCVCVCDCDCDCDCECVCVCISICVTSRCLLGIGGSHV